MRATFYGKVAGPAIAVVGVWDPMLGAHRELFEQIRCQAQRAGLPALAIVIDPDPALMLRGRAHWPVFDDIHTRVQRLFGSGFDAVLRIRFFENDLNAAAAEFFSLVDAHATLAELWLGAHQSLGRGVDGSQETILRLAGERGIQTHRLPPVKVLPPPYDIRQCLAAGRVAEAAEMAGRPPVRSRPRSGALRLAWRPGRYRVLPLASPLAPPTASPFDVELAAMPRGLPRLAWPDPAIKHLAFVGGPADQ